MKRIVSLLFLFLTLLLYASDLSAVEIAAKGTPVRKLQRGFVNIALSPIEVTTAWAQDKNTQSAVPSWATALGRGGLFMVGRALAGVYDMLTAPIPFPADYGPLVFPEFPWEHLPEEEAKSKA
jgi:putative exosortase-associated protein (TIGR04073 family)